MRTEILVYVMFPISFLGKLLIATRHFVNINISYFNSFSLFIFKYWPVYMTEVNLNANNYFDIYSITSKFHMCMYDRMKYIYVQNQPSIHYSCLWKAVHSRTF